MSMPAGTQQGDTGNGFIVGVDPQQNPLQQRQGEQQGTGEQQPNGQQPQGGSGPRYYTEDDVERIRKEEKDKLYSRIEGAEKSLAELQREREAEQKRLQEEREAAEAAARKKEEEGMEVRVLLERRESEWNARFEEMQRQSAADRAIFDRERELQQLETYRLQVVEQNAEFIVPEMRDLVRGNTIEEIDASVEEMKARTKSIFDQITAAQGQQRQAMRGAAPTAPPVGPMEQLPSTQSFSAQDISAMSMDEYKKHREGLLRGAGNAYRGG